jgi:hypothetical protein
MASDIAVEEASLCILEHVKPFAFECFEDLGSLANSDFSLSICFSTSGILRLNLLFHVLKVRG